MARKAVAEMTLGERIASLRKEKNLSQEGLGELVGVSRQAVSKWEADRALPDVNNCVAMSRVFGISLAFDSAGGPSDRRGSLAVAVADRYEPNH